MDCIQIVESAIRELKLGFKCVPQERFLAIVTPYLYPDNDLVEVFVEEIDENTVRVSDLGETLRHLESRGIDLYASRKRKFLLDQIADRIHVQLVRGTLERTGPSVEVGTMVSDVAAAAHSVASLMYTSKAYEPPMFNDEVSDYLTEHQIEHQKHYRTLGISGKRYKVDIRVNGSRSKELFIESMSPSQEGAITATVNRVIRLWVDIGNSRDKVSLLNDLDFTWRDEDLALLRQWSLVQLWSKKEQLLDLARSSRSVRGQ